jgi:hypothetical protein
VVFAEFESGKEMLMPSPFPGMDPYLEARTTWPDLHARLINNISEYLMPLVRPKYVARIGERLQLATIDHSYVPDVMLLHKVRETAPAYGETVVADEPKLYTMLDEAYREPYIEIVALETGDVVTVIEVLSPANKVGDGRDQYIQKQKDLMAAGVNLFEIDLLGYGKETTLARNVIITEPEDWRYIICTYRAKGRRGLEVYAVPLREKLPNCRIPLRPPDEDVVLNLTAVFTRCYDIGGYDLLVDYSKEPYGPLSEAELAWMDGYLREKGVRQVQ